MLDSRAALMDTRSASLPRSMTSSEAGIHVATVHELEEFGPHLAAWDRLASEAPQMIPCLMPGWVDAFLRHRLKPDERWFCCFAYSGTRLVGVLPVVVGPHPLLGIRAPLLRTPSDALTPTGDVLLAPGYEREAFGALLGQVRQVVPAHAGLSMKSVRKRSPLWQALERKPKGYVFCTGIGSKYSFLNVEGAFDTYLSGLGHMRRNLKRFRKKLEGEGPVLLELKSGSPEAEAFLQEFAALEASGWKRRNGTAMIDNRSAIAFYTALAANLAAERRFEWYILRSRDHVIAAQMCIRCGGALMLAKIAFDEAYADCRPGHLLTGEVLRSAFARQDVIEVNHLSNADWEGFWRMSYDEYVDIHLIPKRAIPLMFQFTRAAAWFAYQNYVRPRIPPRLKAVYRNYRRRGDRRPLSSAMSRSIRTAK